jgi:glutathione S-transferase
LELIIGTRKWSSWSMRPWLALKRTGAPFTETLIELRAESNQTRERILPHSPSGLVPALKTEGVVLTDSLAICEFLAEAFPAARLWPADPLLRALGRSAACEMHSGFAALRSEWPMALEIAPRAGELSDAGAANVRRIVEIWLDLLARSGGPFLTGAWSIADAFYTPVATRFRTYQADLSAYGDDGAAAAYAQRLLSAPEFLAWEEAATRDT